MFLPDIKYTKGDYFLRSRFLKSALLILAGGCEVGLSEDSVLEDRVGAGGSGFLAEAAGAWGPFCTARGTNDTWV